MRYLGKNKNENCASMASIRRHAFFQFNIIALICQKIYNIRTVYDY